MFIAGTDGTNLRGILTDATGKIQASFTVSDTTSTGALAALNDAVSVALAGEGGAGFDLAAGTLIGTIVPETSYDNVSWQASWFEDPTTKTKVASIVFAANNGHVAQSIFVPSGARFARVRVSAFTSGTANATLTATTANQPVNLFEEEPGVAAPPTALQMGGTDGTNLRAILTDASGRQEVVGAAANGAAVAGNPVLIAGSDGANARTVLTDASGRPEVVGAAASGSAAVGNPVLTAGIDGSGNARTLLTDATGRLIMIAEKAGTSAVTRVATSNASASLLASTATRLGATIVNESTHKLYIKLGAAASVTSYTVILAANGYYEVPFDYTGAIDGILDAGTGNAQITELTP
jgi:hypothetical protein